MSELREELDARLKEASDKLDAANQAWKERESTLERMVENMKSEVEKSQRDYKNIMSDLDSGNHEYLT